MIMQKAEIVNVCSTKLLLLGEENDTFPWMIKIPPGRINAHLTEEGGWGEGVAWGGGGVVDLGVGTELASSRLMATLSTDLEVHLDDGSLD